MKKKHLFLHLFILIVSCIAVLTIRTGHTHAYTDTCWNCGATLTIPDDTMTVIQMATCTDPGLQSYAVYCSNCGVENTKDNIVVPPLGHDYIRIYDGDIEPTCTEPGWYNVECSRCGEADEQRVAALGHNYQKTTVIAATCTEQGLDRYVCSRCNDTYEEKTKAKGHKFKETVVEPTCEEGGTRTQTCSVCHEEVVEVLAALEHDFGEYEVVQELTCTQDGIKKRTCARCGYEETETETAKGHIFPEEWTVGKPATKKEAGMEYRVCYNCTEREEREIPKIFDPVPIIIGGTSAAIATLAAVYFTVIKPKLKIKKLGPAKRKLDLNLDSRSVFLPLRENKENQSFIDCLKEKHFIDTEIGKHDPDKLAEAVKENECSLVLWDINNKEELEQLKELLPSVREAYEDGAVGVISFDPELKEELKQLKKEEVIDSFALSSDSDNDKLVELILPLYKPELTVENGADMVGRVADALGIPYVSTIVNVFLNGKDIVETVQEGEMGLSESATVIADIADILGLETVKNVAGLVDDVDAIKESAIKNEEAGTYENVEAYKAAKDIVDVLSSLK